MITTYLILKKINGFPKFISFTIIINAFPLRSLYGACVHASNWVIKMVADFMLVDNITNKICLYSCHGKSDEFLDEIEPHNTPINWTGLVKIASKYGNFNVVKRLLPLIDLNGQVGCIRRAIKNGYLEVVKLFPPTLTKTVSNYSYAILFRQFDVAKYLKTDFNQKINIF